MPGGYCETDRRMAVTRIASRADASAIAAVLAEAFDGYRCWAPAEWAPPVSTPPAEVARLAQALARPDVWCLLALDGSELIGHVALSLLTAEDPEPPPSGTINLWQLFVRPAWQGSGVVRQLMDAAVAEARWRGFTTMRLWTPQGAARARHFYEREGWTLTVGLHDASPFGLPVVEYSRQLEAHSYQ
jgi:GNAT superfamily N-acetyltransferase